MEKLKIAIIGGSFNPPTIQHMFLGSEILNLKLANKLIYVPCGLRTDKIIETTPQQRYEMTKIYVNNFFNYNENIKVSDIEVKNGNFIPTYYLLKKFEEIYKDYEIYFTIGTDLLSGLKEWDEGEKLFLENKFIIFNRVGYNVNKSQIPKNSIITDNLIESNISSTIMRKRIKENYNKNDLGIYGIVDNDVIKYIKSNNLFN